jgi:putative sugar O-methyltransferase
MNEREIIERIEEDLRLQKEVNINATDLDSKWQFLVANEPHRFLNPNLTLKIDAIRNFRKLTIFIPDEPTYNPSFLNIKNVISGRRRGIRKLLKECLDVLKEHKYDKLLEKYPISIIGNPYIFRYKGYRYNYRWTKHIYSLGLFKKILGEKLKDNFIILDIGSSYGIFSYLLKKEFPSSHHLLLDFPEQLILAHYFLGMNFPKAKIASFREIIKLEKIEKDFIEKYDFILIPWFFYDRLSSKSIDLITNFASLGEMKRQWFDYYLKQEPFLSTKYFFTENRFQSAPTYDTDLTILDYPLGDFKTLHFGICPIFSHTYKGKYLFFYEKLVFSSQYFEFIGER